jgi:hypothetical protein
MCGGFSRFLICHCCVGSIVPCKHTHKHETQTSTIRAVGCTRQIEMTCAHQQTETIHAPSSTASCTACTSIYPLYLWSKPRSSRSLRYSYL